MKHRDNLIKIVGERTGLKNKEDILAYTNFVDNADWEDGIIMFGDVIHEFYRNLLKNSSPKIQKEEEEFMNLLGNHKIKTKSKLMIKSEEEYEKYLNLFISKGLISKPRFVRKNKETKYPTLMAYNYFNDPEVYTPFRKIGEERWSGRHPNPITNEIVEEYKKMGQEFNFF